MWKSRKLNKQSRRQQLVWTEAENGSLKNRWALLRAGGSGGGELEVPSLALPIKNKVGNLRLALGRQDQPRFLLPIGPDEDVSKVQAGKSLRVSVSVYVYKSRPKRFLDLTCMSKNVEAAFSDLVKHTAERIAKGDETIPALLSVLQEYRELLIGSSKDDVSQSRVLGLIGELVVLNRLLQVTPDAWQSWVGPMGDRHDFRGGGLALEVKTTRKREKSVVTINGASQLLPPKSGSLRLMHIALDESPSTGLSVSSLLKRALTIVDDKSALLKRAAAYGCSDVDSPHWNEKSYSVEGIRFYKVESDFPRIVPSVFQSGNLPTGVSDIVYSIDLSSARKHLCKDDEMESYIRGMA